MKIEFYWKVWTLSELTTEDIRIIRDALKDKYSDPCRYIPIDVAGAAMLNQLENIEVPGI